MQESDIKAVIRLGRKTPELHLREDSTEYYSTEMLQSFIKSPHDIYLVAIIDGDLAGYRLASFNPYLKEAYLIDMVVKPEYRSKGVAKKLYEKTFEILNTKDCVWAWTLVKEGNEPIAEVLKKRGFKKGNKFNAYFKVAPF